MAVALAKQPLAAVVRAIRVGALAVRVATRQPRGALLRRLLQLADRAVSGRAGGLGGILTPVAGRDDQAEALDVPLLTLDSRLARASGVTCEVLVPGA